MNRMPLIAMLLIGLGSAAHAQRAVTLSSAVPEAPTLHAIGREISLPLCEWAKRPANPQCYSGGTYLGRTRYTLGRLACFADIGRLGDSCYYDNAGEPTAPCGYYLLLGPTLDFGGGNAVYNVGFAECWKDGSPLSHPSDGVHLGTEAMGTDTTLLHVTGFVNHVSDAYVRAQVQLEASVRAADGRSGSLILAIQRLEGSVWSDVATRLVDSSFVEVEAYVAANSDVRMELRAPRGFATGVLLRSARLFGAQCFPDFSNPGSCLQ